MFAMNSSASMRSLEGDILQVALNGIAGYKVLYCAIHGGDNSDKVLVFSAEGPSSKCQPRHSNPVTQRQRLSCLKYFVPKQVIKGVIMQIIST